MGVIQDVSDLGELVWAREKPFSNESMAHLVIDDDDKLDKEHKGMVHVQWEYGKKFRVYLDKSLVRPMETGRGGRSRRKSAPAVALPKTPATKKAKAKKQQAVTEKKPPKPNPVTTASKAERRPNTSSKKKETNSNTSNSKEKKEEGEKKEKSTSKRPADDDDDDVSESPIKKKARTSVSKVAPKKKPAENDQVDLSIEDSSESGDTAEPIVEASTEESDLPSFAQEQQEQEQKQAPQEKSPVKKKMKVVLSSSDDDDNDEGSVHSQPTPTPPHIVAQVLFEPSNAGPNYHRKLLAEESKTDSGRGSVDDRIHVLATHYFEMADKFSTSVGTIFGQVEAKLGMALNSERKAQLTKFLKQLSLQWRNNRMDPASSELPLMLTYRKKS